jgi:hypothetical protein
MRGKLTKAQACAQRNRGVPAYPADAEQAGVRSEQHKLWAQLGLNQ